MDINYEKNTISIYGKTIKYDTLIKKLTDLSGEQIYGFFSTRGIMLPRMMNCLALTSVLNDKIKFLHSNSLTKDYFTRLQHYKSFTETQLENLFIATNCDSDDFYKYRYNLMKLIIDNYAALDLNDGEINYLRGLKKGKAKSFEEYAGYISSSSLEQPGTFDGALIDDLKKDLMFTATNQEIILIGEKYGIIIPERLSKEEYLEYIKYYLTMLGKLTDELNERLDSMTLQALSIYSKQNGIPMQPAMSKDDLVTYLFYYLGQCEIPYSSVQTIAYDPTIYEPLTFTVDLAAISPFGILDAKKIIHYEGEEEDLEEFNKMLDIANGVAVAEEEETPIELERPLRPGEFVKNVETEEEKKVEAILKDEPYIEPKKEEVKPKVVEEPKKEIKQIKKEPPLAEKMQIDLKKVEENNQYGSKKIKKLAYKKNGHISPIVIPLIAGVILVAGIVALFFI